MKILDLTLPTPAENLACDEALLDAAEAGQGGEVLRFWESSEPFVVVGYANKVGTEVNATACAEMRIPILRRCSGGGTVVQGPGCLNYALVLRFDEQGPLRNISSANRFIMERNRMAIESLFRGSRRRETKVSKTQNPKSKIEVRGHTDLAVDGVKFSGNSQRRRRDFLLFHGTFLLNFDLALVSQLLPMPSQQPDYRASRAHDAFIGNLNLPAAKVKAALQKSWNAKAPLKNPPAENIAALVCEKYGAREWNSKF